MLGDIGNRFIFPAPDPSYGNQSYKRHLCWIPWNPVISPERAVSEECSEGIPCLWFPAPKAATVILFFHANAEDLGMSFAVLKHMRDQFKVNVLAVEYPGYGLLRSLEPSESAIYEVALTAFRYLVDEVGVRYSQIILFGRSLGSGAACYLAAQYPVGGLILVSAFSSIRAAVQSIVGRVFAWSFKERFPNSRIIANVSCSTLFIHGEADGLIPAEHSLRLFKRCRARKLLITPPKMEHNSNLFGDASFLAVPAIHFFGFPGYYTSSPPRLPAKLFECPEKIKQKPTKFKCESAGVKLWLCDCLAKNEQHSLDVTLRRPEMNVEDITIRFFNSGDNSSGSAAGGQGQATDGQKELSESHRGSSDDIGQERSNAPRSSSSIARASREDVQQASSRGLGHNKASPSGPMQPSLQEAPASEEEQGIEDLDEVAAASLLDRKGGTHGAQRLSGSGRGDGGAGVTARRGGEQSQVGDSLISADVEDDKLASELLAAEVEDAL